jgi:hypothetical protein
MIFDLIEKMQESSSVLPNELLAEAAKELAAIQEINTKFVDSNINKKIEDWSDSSSLSENEKSIVSDLFNYSAFVPYVERARAYFGANNLSKDLEERISAKQIIKGFRGEN